MQRCHLAGDEVVGVCFDPGHGDIARSFACWPVQPDCDVIEGLALELLDGRGIPEANWEVIDVMAFHFLSDAGHCEHLA